MQCNEMVDTDNDVMIDRGLSTKSGVVHCDVTQN
jgi:hypothetical protein